jgi:hypothetical protein
VVDSPKSDITTDSRPYRHVDVRAGEVKAYAVHGRPWRTYAAAPVWRSGERSGFAGEMVLMGFYQRQGSNIRGSALLLFVVQIAAALAIVLVSYWLLTRYWTRTGSWISVALLSAGGGALAGALFVLRPPDLGGYDDPLDPVSCVLFVAMISGVIGTTGCFFAWLRELIDRMSPGRHLLLTSLAFPFVALMTHGVRTKWSAFAGPTSVDTGLHLRTAYYLYFATSVALPLVLFHETGAHTDETAEVHSRVRRLFGIAAFSGLLAFLVGFTIDNVLEVANPGQLFRGFYKPAGGVGLWLVSLVIIAGLSFALVMGTRPRWIQDLNEDLARFADEPDPSARLRYRQRILAVVFTHMDSLDVHRHHLVFAARQAPRVIQPLLDQPSEIEQFVEALESSGATRSSVDHARQRFVAALERLAKIAPRESRIEAPLLLIDERTRGLVQGKIGVARFFDPGVRRGIGVDVCLKGVPLEPESALRKHVRTLVDLVNDEILLGIRRDAFDRHRIEVDFQYEQEADLSGASYELPLALALVGFVVENRPIWKAWAATGQIRRDTFHVDVVDLGTKCAFLADGGPRRILISAASSVSTCRTTASTISCLDAEHRREFEQVRRDVLHALTHEGSVLLGVATVQQAVEILYGIRVTASKR